MLALVTPKCPLCIAAALSAWGIGAAAAAVIAPAIEPVLLAVTALAIGVFAAVQLNARQRARTRAARPVAQNSS